MQTTMGERLFAAAALLALAAVSIPAAQLRFIDGDEGFYLMAARLVSEGRRLYADFFFPQMPLLPEIYGGWFALAGVGWRSGRVLAALCAIGAGLLLGLEVRRRTGSARWGALAIALYLGSGLVLGWFTTAKSYGLAALLLLGGVAAVQRPGARAAFAGGALLALASGTRLYLAVALPCACLYLAREGGPARRRRLLALGAGVLLAMLPLLPTLVRDARAFYFGNVVFHTLRDAGAMQLSGQLARKGWVLLSVLGIWERDGNSSTQLVGLGGLAVAAAVSRATPRNQLTTSVWIALAIASLVPTPAYPQYFCLVVPFLVQDAITFVATLPASQRRFVVPVGGLAYLVLGVLEAHRYLVSGADVPGVIERARRGRWSISTMERVAEDIDRQRQPRAISWWPGYLLSTRTEIVPELANDFGMLVAGRLPEAERRRYHLVSHTELGRWIDEQRVSLVVVGNWASRESRGLGEKGYRMVARLQNVEVWSLFPPR
jgi:hypothetical protein